MCIDYVCIGNLIERVEFGKKLQAIGKSHKAKPIETCMQRSCN